MKVLLVFFLMGLLQSCSKSEKFNPYITDNSDHLEKPLYIFKNKDFFYKELPKDLRIAEFRAETLKYSEMVNSVRSYYVRKALMEERGMSDYYGRDGIVAEFVEIFKEDFDEKSTREFYEKNKSQFEGLDLKKDKQWLEKVKYGQLVDHITKNFIRKSKELADRGDLIINFLPPDIKKTGIDFSKYPSVGNPKAPYHLMAVTNYFCENCRTANKEVNELFKIYGKDLSYTHVGHAFNINDVSMDSILLGNCVSKIDSSLYWKFHNELFSSKEYSDIKLFDNLKFKKRVTSTLKKLNIDTEKVFNCISEKENRYEASNSLKFFKNLSLVKVPTFYLNGRVISIEEFNSLVTGFTDMKRRIDNLHK